MKIIFTILFTLILMFATSLLLDVQLVKDQWIRQFIVYLLIGIELIIGFMMFKYLRSKL
jgi:hypothetical protein